MEKVKNYIGKKPGPKPKGRISSQINITLPPEVNDLLAAYMRSNSLNNRSGTIAHLLKLVLDGNLTGG